MLASCGYQPFSQKADYVLYLIIVMVFYMAC